MPVLNLTVTATEIQPAHSSMSIDHALSRAVRSGGAEDPIVLLLHGFRYSPLRGPSNPHETLYAVQPALRKRPKRQTSWTAALGYRGADADPGLCLPIGWDARGIFAGAFHKAEEVGAALAVLIRQIHRIAPRRPIKLMGHSLGGRVALAALRALPAPMVRQIILLAPADFASHARTVLSSPAGRDVEILQVSPAENWVFDRLMEHALRSHPNAGPALGRCPPKADNWVALDLNSPAELQNLKALGHTVAPRGTHICHWSAYLREGVMDLYSALLTDRGPRALQDLVPPRALP